MPQALGKPTVNLTSNQVLYFNHTLDDVHILSFEYDGDFDTFCCFAIDG